MSDKLFVIPIDRLLRLISEEEKTGKIFGVHKELFFSPSQNDPFRLKQFGKTLETPIGTAAGPHTQMAQNIITAWLTGARYIELKTVQTLDELEVSKPCIDAEDEGYNCEWSQELRIKESFEEYLKAWIIIHILNHKFGREKKNTNDPGFIFNMSVGYNMEGILNENVQWFLDKMENCGKEKQEQIQRLTSLYPQVKDMDIPDRVSDNITLSTMHGCPPEEIEKIALYLIKEKKYHTCIKLNPTLLGPGPVREILNKKLGFDTVVPDEAFEHDLKYPDAVKMIKTLIKSAKQAGVNFGLKLTNTLESVNHREVFPAQETMMYMSGRALHPVSINLAAKLQESFNGDLDISFCAGVDCFNITEVIGCGLKPVTVCTDILKPGGYARLLQYLDNLSEAMKTTKSRSIHEYILAKNSGKEKNIKAAALGNLKNYASTVSENQRYKKSGFPGQSIKTARDLGYFDCIQAPCITTCPTNQEVPDYMYYTAKGDYERALAVILNQNPFPAVTGKVCDHPCMTKCTRLNYDNPLQIRAVKGFISDVQKEEPALKPAPRNGLNAAVIGAGPSGLSCAFFLALAGFAVNVHEAQNIPGGMVSRVIPGFRLTDKDIKKDIRRIERLGVKIHYNTRIDKESFENLEKNNDYIYIGIGAQTGTPMNIKGENLPGVMDALTFLSRARRKESMTIGSKTAVVGGGNSAMDAARTALRMAKKNGPDAEVTILYRRTPKEMPAAPEEIKHAINEGIKINELTTPVEIKPENNRLNVRCWKMKLGEKDESGRRRPIKIENSDFTLYFDTVIIAVGQTVELDFLKDRQWKPVKETGETAIKNVYIGGDALRGPSSIITAAADGKKAALSISSVSSVAKKNPLKLMKSFCGGPGGGFLEKSPLAAGGKSNFILDKKLSLADHQQKSARRLYGEDPLEMTEKDVQKEARRCLFCDDICNICVTVCPNRANVSYTIEPKEYFLQKAINRDGKIEIAADKPFCLRQPYQVCNIADFCNECGNCRTFCPTAGAPYKDKPKICLTEESFRAEPRGFFMGEENGKRFIKSKKESGDIETLFLEKDRYIYETPCISAILDKNNLRVKHIRFKPSSPLEEVDFKHAAEMSILLTAIGY
jgi:putative selenate reductase